MDNETSIEDIAPNTVEFVDRLEDIIDIVQIEHCTFDVVEEFVEIHYDKLHGGTDYMFVSKEKFWNVVQKKTNPDPTTVDVAKIKINSGFLEGRQINRVYKDNGKIWAEIDSHIAVPFVSQKHFWMCCSLLPEDGQCWYFVNRLHSGFCKTSLIKFVYTSNDKDHCFDFYVSKKGFWLKQSIGARTPDLYKSAPEWKEITKEEAENRLIDSIEIPENYTRWYGDESQKPVGNCEVLFRSGIRSDETYLKGSCAKGYNWRHSGRDSDIVAYKLVEEPQLLTFSYFIPWGVFDADFVAEKEEKRQKISRLKEIIPPWERMANNWLFALKKNFIAMLGH